MTQYGFYFAAQRCNGCKTCSVTCQDFKNLPIDVRLRDVCEYNGGEWTQNEDGTWNTSAYAYYISGACNHCDNPACIEVCPVGAIFKDEETGIVANDTTACIGCQSCVEACPYGAPCFNAEDNVTRKCDMCASRVAEGMNPICVDACPTRALECGPIDELREKYGDTACIAPMPDPSATGPNVCMTAPAREIADDAALVNPNEIA